MKENYASVYAYIGKPPEIRTGIKPDGTSVLKAALIIGLTCRIPHRSPEGEVEAYKWDRLLICSFNPSFINKYLLRTDEGENKQVKTGDMAIVEGAVRIKDKEKKIICPGCGMIQLIPCPTVYIDPTYLYVCESGITEEEAAGKLTKANESSNIIHYAGTVYGNPEFTERDGKESSMLSICLYEKDDDMSINPWVKAFGKRAREYSSMIHDGSEIYISGSLQTRIQEKSFICPECHQKYDVQMASTMLVPYRIEPVRNCDIPGQELMD